jgi:SpoIID/LytB domain protein
VLRLSTGKVETVDLEEYVAAVLPGEIGGHAPAAALEAQAVAARSYAVARVGRHVAEGADLCDGVHCQVYRGPRASTEASRRAVEETRGLVLMQRGRVIAAPFHAACGGHTTRPADVWDDEDYPILEGVPDDACAGAPGARWSWRIPRASLPALGAELGIAGARFFEVFGRGSDGRVAMLRLVAPGGHSLSVRGYAFREAALRLWGPASVRSTLFEVFEEPKEYVLSGRGTGHGAGLCQEGAIARARRGEGYRQILATYYRGAEIGTLDEAGTR